MKIDFRPIGGLIVCLIFMFIVKPVWWASFYGVNWVLGLLAILWLIIMFRKYIFNLTK